MKKSKLYSCLVGIVRNAKTYCILASLVWLISGCTEKEKRPNILWITFEDTSPQFLGVYGNQDARTPTMDKLANEGVRFTNAFSTGTVCSPSRTAIITGVKTYKTGTGNHRSDIQMPDFIKGFPAYLQEVGYYTSNNKKTDYNVEDEERFIAKAWNESSGKAGWWNRETGQPFFSVFNFTESHQSRTMTESYEWYKGNIIANLDEDEIIKDDEFEMPPFYHDSPEMRKQFARVYNALKLTDKKIAQLLQRLKADGLLGETIIFFYADHGEGMPRGKTNGINYGYRVPFVVWFPEKYKELSPWGTEVVTDELVDFTDLAPTLISLTGGKVPEYMEGRILFGSERQKPTNHLVISSDRSDNGPDMVRTVTDGRYVYSRNFMPYMPELRYIRYMEIGEIKQQMREDYKAGKLDRLQNNLFAQRPPVFLFDLEADPWETQNLANNPNYKEIVGKMESQLMDEVLQSKDIMFLPEYELSLVNKTVAPYNYRLDTTRYPIAEIYKVASLSGYVGSNVAQQQIAFLQDTNKIVRYWAAMGLRSQNAQLLEKYASEIRDAMDDDYPPVSVIASAIAYQQFHDSRARQLLQSFCLSNNEDLALMAVNYLLYIDEKEPFIETIKLAHDKEGRSYNVKAACMDFLGSLGLVPNNTNYRQ
ncbi:sulfatase family protein [Sunxiuqinia indica]|uniref:sulfatase family protein n=1 Tax=Sunxiuqinia indica TaxID=2692584 RepID=UPI0013597273|nr:sulfatase [Sunxiuqinia indica]